MNKTYKFQHLPELDGLRGIAILIVVVGHFFKSVNPGLGVDLFFVLSGFLITMLLLKELDRHRDINLKFFYARRVLRLFPALILAVVGTYVLSLFGYLRFPSYLLPWLLTYSTNFALAFKYVTSNHFQNPLATTWSLAVEEQFYLAWPFLFLLLTKRFERPSATRVCLAVLLFWEAYRWWVLTTNISAPRSYYGTDTHGQLIWLGCILAFARTLTPDTEVKPKQKLAWNTAISLVLVATLSGKILFDLYVMTMTLWGLAFGVLIWTATLQLGLYNAVLKWGVLRYFGRISYGLYLYHIPIHVVCKQLVEKETLASILAFALSLLVSELSFSLIEKPILRYKKKFTR